MTLPIKWIGASDNYTPGRTQPLDIVVMHWMVGTLASCDATFTNPARNASATYGLNGSEIHQYVKESDTAWANGHSNPAKNTNPRSISIEHEGGWSIPGGRFKPTPETHETSARLLADIVSRNPQITLDRNHIKKHNEVADTGTECPGTLDIDWIIQRAKQLLGGMEMNIWPDPITPLIAKMKKPIPMYDIQTGKVLTDSGLDIYISAVTDIIDGSTYYIPKDRADAKQVFGFREEDLYGNGTVTQEATPVPAPGITEQQKKDMQTGQGFRELVKQL